MATTVTRSGHANWRIERWYVRPRDGQGWWQWVGLVPASRATTAEKALAMYAKMRTTPVPDGWELRARPGRLPLATAHA